MKIEKILENYIAVEKETDNLADFFSAFSDKTRLKIICLLSMDDMCVNDISFVTGLNQSAVSHQLRTLKDGGAINCYKDGKKTYYYLKNKHIENLLYQAVVASEESVR